MKDINETERRMAERARMYMEKLIQGINPVDDSCVKNDSVINNEKIKLCFRYIANVLEFYEEVLYSTPEKRHIYQKKMPFDLSIVERQNIPVTNDYLKISEFTKNINTLVDENFYKTLKSSAINEWLLRNGFLEEVVTKDGKHHKWPTDAGLEIGIKKEQFFSKNHFPYYVVLYGRDAQQFIADNIGEIIDVNNEKKKSKRKKYADKLVIPEMPDLNKYSKEG